MSFSRRCELLRDHELKKGWMEGEAAQKLIFIVQFLAFVQHFYIYKKNSKRKKCVFIGWNFCEV